MTDEYPNDDVVELPQPVLEDGSPEGPRVEDFRDFVPSEPTAAPHGFPIFDQEGDAFVAQDGDLTLEQVAKEHRNGRRPEHGFQTELVKAEIVRQIQERVPRK